MRNHNRYRTGTIPTLTDVLGAECCHPHCHAPASDRIASQVPLCEDHIFDVYRSVNQLLTVQNAKQEEYALLPLEQRQIPGPCPSCGYAGLLALTVLDNVCCLNAGCRYEAHIAEFERLRRSLLFDLAANRSVVYYIKFRDCVKIGTSIDLRSRCQAVVIEMLYGFEPGGRILERHRHTKFAAYRTVGEWFEDNRHIRAHINNVCELVA